ncbi:hypothetical protein BDD12DRAFT_892256 [Trichophaea hybrida]|nr:hypothetical protein BDD12DRAFT_892256 [Trichophaea hybrida]
MLFTFDSQHEIEFESVGRQDDTQHDKMTKWDVTDIGSGIPEGTSRLDPGLEAMRQAFRDTTAVALTVATGVGPNSKLMKARKKVMFNAPPTDLLDPPSPLDNSEKIEDLCLAIHETVNTDSIGVITAEEGCDGVYVLLLEHGTLEVRDRLKLGVALATAMMQLHTTKWFGESESWGRRDIFFPQETANFEPVGGEAVSIRRPIIDNPFVRQAFSIRPQNTTRLTNSELLASLFVRYDRSVFSLGIVLIELWIGKRLEDLPEYLQIVNSGQNTDTAQYGSASLLIDKIREEAGPMYGDAVRRCIRDLDYPKNSLDDKDFKTEVQAMVVAGLERNWKAYIDQESQEQ